MSLQPANFGDQRSDIGIVLDHQDAALAAPVGCRQL
jgi:hypothetical protein